MGRRLQIPRRAPQQECGERLNKNFEKRGDAVAFLAQVQVDIAAGKYAPPDKDATVRRAAELWLEACENPIGRKPKEETTIDEYRRVAKHILGEYGPRDPSLAAVRLGDLTTGMIEDFLRDLQTAGRSHDLVRRARTALSSMLKVAVRRKLVAVNVALDVDVGEDDERHKEPRKIPTIDEGFALVNAADTLRPKWRALALLAMCSGMRSSELRGLRWSSLDFDAKPYAKLRVVERLDKKNKMGPVKSKSARRELSLPVRVVNALREWRLACPKGELGLVFPANDGGPMAHRTALDMSWWPVQVAAFGEVRYTGTHASRHWFASAALNSRDAGGMGLELFSVSKLLGHSTINLTSDTYGHLQPRKDDGGALDAFADGPGGTVAGTGLRVVK
jgi:integrase